MIFQRNFFMKKILNIISSKGIKCYQTERFNLDHKYLEKYEDEGEIFDSHIIFESDHKTGQFIKISPNSQDSFFKYFLDGSRYTYKIADMATTDGKYLPIIAGQVATGVTIRDGEKIRRYIIKNKNLMLVSDRTNQDDLAEIKEEVKHFTCLNIEIETYNSKRETASRPENLAIARIQKIMMDMEIEILSEIARSRVLKPDSMLIIDGSLQFIDKGDDRLFSNVIGLSKSFNPNLQGMLRRKNDEIGIALTKLKYGERTPVYKYPMRQNSRVIGAWYLRIRDEKRMKNPLDGIVKMEKIAIDMEEKDNGFESGLINNISASILAERNVTCYGRDPRWHNHIYPMYLTEKMLKSSFLGTEHFLNIF